MSLIKPAISETALKQALDKKDLELVSYDTNKDGSLAVEANKLYPALTDAGGPLYVPLPVSLNVSPEGAGKVKSIEDDAPDAGATESARDFVKMLIDNKQLNGLPGEQRANASHKIDINEKGQRVVRRQGFSGMK
jgi:hypothetical protein